MNNDDELVVDVVGCVQLRLMLTDEQESTLLIVTIIAFQQCHHDADDDPNEEGGHEVEVDVDDAAL